MQSLFCFRVGKTFLHVDVVSKKIVLAAAVLVCPFLNELRGDGFYRDRAQAGGTSRLANKFIEGVPRLAVRVRVVDRIDSFLEVSSIALVSFVQAEKVRTKQLHQSQSPLGLRRRSDRGSRTLCPNMACSSSDGHVGCIVWLQIADTRKILSMPSRCLSCSEVAISQRIHLGEGKSTSNQPCESFNASPDRCGQKLLGLGDVMSEGQCCNRRSFPRTRLSGSQLSSPKFAKARSGLMPTFHR